MSSTSPLLVAALVAAAAPSGVLSPGTDEAAAAKEPPSDARCVSDPRCRSRLLQMRGRLLRSDTAAAARELARDLTQIEAEEEPTGRRQQLGSDLVRELVGRGAGRGMMQDHAKELEHFPVLAPSWDGNGHVAGAHRDEIVSSAQPEWPHHSHDSQRRAPAAAVGCPRDGAVDAEPRTYGLLDVSGNGTLTLMQSLPPFESRSDLTLERSVHCPKLRARIRALFAAGMDLDLLVYHERHVDERHVDERHVDERRLDERHVDERHVDGSGRAGRLAMLEMWREPALSDGHSEDCVAAITEEVEDQK